MEYKATKLYDDGTVGVRDKEVNEAIKKNDVMHVKYDDGIMSMDPESLKTKLVRKGSLQQSQFHPDEWYRVNYYMWDPNIENND